MIMVFFVIMGNKNEKVVAAFGCLLKDERARRGSSGRERNASAAYARDS